MQNNTLSISSPFFHSNSPWINGNGYIFAKTKNYTNHYIFPFPSSRIFSIWNPPFNSASTKHQLHTLSLSSPLTWIKKKTTTTVRKHQLLSNITQKKVKLQRKKLKKLNSQTDTSF